MIRTKNLISAVAGVLLVFGPAVAGTAVAQDSATPAKKILHNPTVAEIVDQLSRGKQKHMPRMRGLTVGPPATQTASAAPSSGCYAVGARTATRGLTVMADAASHPGASAGTEDCHPGFISLIRFGYNSARLEPVSKGELDKVAAALHVPALQDDKFVIAGHTDAAGSDTYNMTLSERRAASVVRYLAQHGVDKSRLVAEGRGETELLDKKDPLSAVNRRVEIINASR